MILSPTLLSHVSAATAAAAYALAAAWPARAVPEGSGADGVQPSPPGRDPAWWLLAGGWLAHAVAIVAEAVDWTGTSWVARFGFAPALSVTLWMVLAVYAWERMQLDSVVARRTLAGLAAVSVALAMVFPGQPQPRLAHGLAPLHWVLGIASYGLFGAALLHALFWRLAERHLRSKAPGPMALASSPRPGIPLLKLESLTLRFALAGFVVLTATLVLGSLFAQPWRWDHKTLFSLMAWLVFAVLLGGRHWLGWRGRTAIGWLYAGSALLLLAYVGSRFVLEVLLHRPPVAS